MTDDSAAPLSLPRTPPPCSEVSLSEVARGPSLYVTQVGTGISSPPMLVSLQNRLTVTWREVGVGER